jgi:hypothetical protein
MKKVVLIGALIVFSNALLFAENEFYFRLMPQIAGPVGVENFETGFGAASSLDWNFLQFPRFMSLGLSLGGGISRLGIADGSSFSMLEGGLGPFFQWRAMDRLTLRADISGGVYNYRWGDDSNNRFRLGGSLSAYYHLLPSVALYASGGFTYYSFSESQPINAITAGVGVSLNLGEILRPQTRVRGEKTEQQRVFPVSYAWYEKNSVATVKITNNEPNMITDINLSFFLERYMNQGTVFAEVARLRPGESVEMPVTALFNESMLDLTQDTNSNAAVIIDYRSLGAKRQASFPVQMPIYHRNAMSWDDDRRAASFVSARDPAASLFARYTASTVRRYIAANPLRYSGIPENVLLAAALFEALTLYGINYVIDHASSYIELSENASALDSLNYPYQTLMYRGGDCDDLSILFCALLEVLEIETAFITIPGHIYMAFDFGSKDETISDRDRENVIEAGGRFWVPVEITVPSQGFAEARRVGMRQWRSAGETGQLYPMRNSWAVYPPVSVPGAGDRLPDMPEEAEIIRLFEAVVPKIR